MEYFAKNKSPYYGVFQSCIMLFLFTAGMILFFYIIFGNFTMMQGKEKTYCALGFGGLVGSLFSLSCAIAGLFKGTFIIVKNRIVEFFENLSISFKFAIKYYIENIKEYGIVFWIFLTIIAINVAVTIYGFVNHFALID